MRVVEITEPGGPEVLRVAERPDLGDPRPGEVRIRVRASGVNRADLLQRLGRYPVPEGYPNELPGLEYAGVVEAAGDGCQLRKEGDPVMGILGGAGYAEQVLVPERETIRIPRGIGFDEAGGLSEVFITAWDALFNQAHLATGETVLIHAVGSGVGTAALQLSRVAGVRTVGTSRTAAKVARAVELGLDEGILARDETDWSREVHARVGERGVDVILDLVGAAYLEGNLRVLATGARWMVVGVPSGRAGRIDLRKLMGQRATMIGTVLRARPTEEKMMLAREFERSVVPLFEAGRLAPMLDRVFQPEDCAEAHRCVERNETFGKVVFRWSDG